MAALLIIPLLAFLYFAFVGSGSSGGTSSGRSKSYSDQQRWAYEFEMDSYDDEQHWGDD